MSDLSRRHFIAGLGMTASLPFLHAASAAQAPASLLPLNTPKIDHLDVIVPNVEASARFYMGVFNGKEASRDKAPERVWFQIGETRLGLEQSAPGQKPQIAHFGVKVAGFDRRAVSEGLVKLGAKIVPSPDEAGVLRFTDLDGISVELNA